MVAVVTGAPARLAASTETSTITVYIPRAEKKALRLYCLDREVAMSDYVLGLIRKDQAR